MMALVKPKFFIPRRGERRMLHKSGDMIVGMGHDRRNIIIGENGRVIEPDRQIRQSSARPSFGARSQDGMASATSAPWCCATGKLLADEGMVVAVMTRFRRERAAISGLSDIISRGFVYEKENDKLIDELSAAWRCRHAYRRIPSITDWASIKAA